jgi:putative membrane protein
MIRILFTLASYYFMTTEILLRYLHFISIFAIVGALVSEHLLLKPELTRAELKRLSRIDAVYGIAAVLLLTAGLTLWFSGVGKPTVFYSKNWVFHLKIASFAIIGLLSIYPTVFFIKQSKGEPTESVVTPKIIFWMLRIELLLLFVIPLLAGLMSRGVGFFENTEN